MTPDNTSLFVIAESAWIFGAESQTSPAVFRVPNRVNATIHISGRAANVHGRECAVEVSPLTRYTIGGAAADLDVPPAPLYALRLLGQGLVEVSGIGFETFENTRSITGANLTLHYVDELTNEVPPLLNAAIDAEQTVLELSTAGSAQTGSILQIGTELVVVEEISNEGLTYTVTRGSCGSEATARTESKPVWRLERKITVLPFSRGFFGTPSSGSYSQTLTLPDIRIVAAEMSVTNTRGTSQAGWASYANTPDGGLRTLSGGQILLQVNGPLAIQSNAVPAILMDASHAVRDVSATVMESATGGAIELNVTVGGTLLCTLTIAEDELVSNVVDGGALGALQAGDPIGLDIVAVGQATPGAGLSVSIRF